MKAILVVEDNDRVREMIIRILEFDGYKTLEAGTSSQALEVIRRHSDSVDLVLADKAIPRIAGPSIVRLMKKHQPGLKVRYITGCSTNDNHGSQLLPTPFSMERLSKEIHTVLGRVHYAQRHAVASGLQQTARGRGPDRSVH
jgi:two-component system cell cycle sensor histidine kinase/response regulator CckA